MTPTLKRIGHLFAFVTLVLSAVSMRGQLISAPEPQSATITGTVTDANGGVIPGATVTAVGTLADERHEVIADGAGLYSLSGRLHPALFGWQSVQTGFADWSSADMTLSPGQQVDVSEIKLSLKEAETTVNAIFADQLALDSQDNAPTHQTGPRSS